MKQLVNPTLIHQLIIDTNGCVPQSDCMRQHVTNSKQYCYIDERISVNIVGTIIALLVCHLLEHLYSFLEKNFKWCVLTLSTIWWSSQPGLAGLNQCQKKASIKAFFANSMSAAKNASAFLLLVASAFLPLAVLLHLRRSWQQKWCKSARWEKWRSLVCHVQ